MADRLVTRKTAASMLDVDPMTIWRWGREGRLPRVPYGHQFRYRESDVEALRNAPPETAPEAAPQVVAEVAA